MNGSLGLSGNIAKRFLATEITPLLALLGLLLGLFAVLVTPREEEPQINVTFANVFVPFPGATVSEVEQLVSTPAEQVLSRIEGVKHVYSVSRPGMAVLTVQFEVGEDRTRAIVRLYDTVFSNQDWLPASLGVGQPIIKPKGIDDVPIVSLTLWSQDQNIGAYELQQVAHAMEVELKRVKGTRDVYTLGGPDRVVHVLLDPVRMAGYGIALDDLRQSLRAGNTTQDAGALVRDNAEILVRAGTFLSSAGEIGALVVALHAGAPVYLRDVAEIVHGADQSERYAWLGTGPAAAQRGTTLAGEFPAVTIALSKQPGTNAVSIAEQVVQRVEQIRGTVIPDDVQVTVTRNYGETANDKAMTLITKLVFATASVVLLVGWALGRREAVIVGAAVVITLAMTLFASWAWGFTLNRVSLFALIFSIGILVDDAIVVVENIHRHLAMGKGGLRELIPVAVDEVGGPTILATFTVIAALLPMAFVSGLMGPYMSPIPVNASMGMLISLAVAFVITPWLVLKLLPVRGAGHGPAGVVGHDRLYGLFNRYMRPFLHGEAGRARRWQLFGAILLLIVLSVGLAFVKLVVLKMLPFDNKSEFQVQVDMPEGTALEKTAAVLRELGAYLATVPEVTDYQAYAGTAAPINFNGLVRQYYLRSAPYQGDIQVNLVDRKHRDRQSHEIALAVRSPLQEIGRRHGANVKLVEVPPGPPVQAPLVAEIYGLDHQGQIAMARQVREVFEGTKDVVDVDDSVETAAPRWLLKVDQHKAALLGVSQQSIATAITTLLSGEDVSYLRGDHAKYPTPIRVELPVAAKADLNAVLAFKLPGRDGKMLPLHDLVEVVEDRREYSIYHKDLLPVVFVTGDVAGELDSPLYGMFDIKGQLDGKSFTGGYSLDQVLFQPPEHPYRYTLKWDGEWQITFETFRDMGLAYGVGILLIYLLVVAQFRSYRVPLVIMAPIPLTIIGVMPGHALLQANFTATSMIGMIALAGIIVRNSILLVDFINQELARGVDFEEAVIRSGAVRAKPILLTGVAAMLGALFILDDPIFSGLAISLLFGILASTLLTLLVIPVMYYAWMRNRVSVSDPASVARPG
ncbi:MAG: multidrug transporter AcrB [Gammaproteobacteria bacterium RBG_16_57_12]|nr:MAG: multidrug transporter AcrB [Gammaproteobacteria bacterium RBG_16_57_12]